MNEELSVNGSESFPPKTTLQLLYYGYMPFCVVVGLTGNCMVWILIRSNSILSKLPTNSYLLTLAAMSSLFLVSLLAFWLEEDVIRAPMFNRSRVWCKVLAFVAHLCDFSSVWLIVLVGLERLVLLYRRSRSLSHDRARAQIATLLAVAVLSNSWILYVANVDEESGECDIYPEFELVYNLFTAFETIFCMALPSVVIISSNLLLVCQLRKHLKQVPASPTVSFNTADLSTTAPSNTLKSAMLSRSVHRASLGRLSSRFSIAEAVPSRKKQKNLRYTDIQLTRSLLVVTWAFIALNLPNYLYRISTNILNVNSSTELMQKASLVAHVLLYTHHAFLFYLYIFYSPQMKKRLKPTALKLLECYCLKPVHDYTEQT